jgi:hypothetical protein
MRTRLAVASYATEPVRARKVQRSVASMRAAGMCQRSRGPAMTRFAVRAAIVSTVAALGLSACVVVPLGSDGRPYAVQPIPPNPAVLPGGTAAPATAPAPATNAPVVMTARLYPINDVAAQAGVLSGSVINHLDGRGEFQLVFAGEQMLGQATRTNDQARRGVANAYGPRGTHMSCEYQMMSATRGTGTCSLSNGGRYTLHLGG